MPQSSTRLLDFNVNRSSPPQGVPPRDAATVITLREGERGLEVFCVLRHVRSGFLGGAVVFPGGKVDASDAAEGWSGLSTPPHLRAHAFATEALSARTLAIAACRETLEEAAILPTLPLAHGIEDGRLEPSRLSGVAPDLSAFEVELLRAEVRGSKGSLFDALQRRGRRLALDALFPWGRWVTPEAESRRFDARFFLLVLPEGQAGRHDDHETTMSFWAPPKEVLDRFLRGELFLAPPTTRTLEILASVTGVQSAVALADRQSLEPICPRFVADDGGGSPYLALPGDPSHEVQERRIAGSTRFVLRDGIFVSADEEARAEDGAFEQRA